MSDASEFQIPTLRMPTPEQHRAASLQWLARIKPTLIDQWPAELAALSMPTDLVQIDAAQIYEAICQLHDGGKIAPALHDLAAKLDDRMGWNRKFVRLNSRSPKDWPWPFEVPATMSGKEAVSMMAASERIIEDLMEFHYLPEQPCFVCLREWVWWMRSDFEFRCFVKDGKLIAVTHYDYTRRVPKAVINGAADIRTRIDRYFTEKLRHCLPVETVVFDVAMQAGAPQTELMLVEINPYGWSDPCWFGTYEAVERSKGGIETSSPED